jgi:hypothetical protein
MVMQKVTPIIVCLLLLVQLCPGQPSCAMPSTKSWLRLAESAGSGTDPLVDTLWFGFDSTATSGLDSQLCEFEIPLLHAPRFIALDGGGELGNGTQEDFRAMLSATQIDTHRFVFGSPGWTECIFQWSPSGLREICDSAVLVDGFGIIHVRLDQGDSVMPVPNIAQVPTFLIRYGIRSPFVGVGPELSELGTFKLYQNYPNPFNPTTEIRYDLPARAFVVLEVIDITGQVVATLAKGVETPGSKSAQFDARGIGSGVYFTRLLVDGSVRVNKMIILR